MACLAKLQGAPSLLASVEKGSGPLCGGLQETVACTIVASLGPKPYKLYHAVPDQPMPALEVAGRLIMSQASAVLPSKES